jgi:hypothetical protein
VLEIQESWDADNLLNRASGDVKVFSFFVSVSTSNVRSDQHLKCTALRKRACEAWTLTRDHHGSGHESTASNLASIGE